MNSVEISGNLTRDPELMSTPAGLSICKFSIAWNQRKKGADDEWFDVPHFFDVDLFGGRGERMADKAVKGDKVFVTGRLHFSSWEASDGSGKRSKVSITADDCEGEFNFRKAGEGRTSKPAQGDFDGGTPATGNDDDIPF